MSMAGAAPWADDPSRTGDVRVSVVRKVLHAIFYFGRREALSLPLLYVCVGNTDPGILK